MGVYKLQIYVLGYNSNYTEYVSCPQEKIVLRFPMLINKCYLKMQFHISHLLSSYNKTINYIKCFVAYIGSL